MNKVRTSLLAATAVTSPQDRSICIRLVGEVVMGAEDVLADVVERLSRFRPAVVTLDLTAVTFVCSTFAKFIADVLAAAPGASVTLHNPSRMARLVLEVTGLDATLTMRDEPIHMRIGRRS